MSTILASRAADILPRAPVGDVIEAVFDWLGVALAPLWDFISLVIQTLFDWVSYVLLTPPAISLVLSGAVIAWLARGWRFGIVTLIGMALTDSMQQWQSAMQTLSLILIAGAIAAVIGVPVGILASRQKLVSAVIRPALDFMQTLHPFVYLPITIAFFSIGVVSGTVATIIFAMPPAVRLTELGIRQVDKEMVEAGEAFGARPRQILTRIQVPLAVPTIMAGINQVIMLSLSMVVLAGLVGTPGLGQTIVFALSRVNIGLAFEAGIALVVIAIFLDRTTGVIGQRSAARQG